MALQTLSEPHQWDTMQAGMARWMDGCTLFQVIITCSLAETSALELVKIIHNITTSVLASCDSKCILEAGPGAY